MAISDGLIEACCEWDHQDFPFVIFPLEKYLGNCSDELQRNSFFQLYFFERGGGQDYVDFCCRPISDFSAHFVMPRQLHKLEAGPESTGDVIVFGRNLFCHEHINVALRDYCFNVLSRISSINLQPTEYEEVKDILQSIKLLYQGETRYKREKIRLYFRILILRLTEISAQTVADDFQDPERELFIRFLQLLEQNYKEIRFVADYARSLSISGKKLNALTRKYKGQTALEVIHERILLEAKRLIMASEQNYKEIAYDLGFDSPSAFSKFILAKAGCSPSALKMQMAQIYKPLE